MPYALTGSVSSDPIDGGTEITSEQYEAAIQGMCEGLKVVVDDGQFSLVQPPAPEDVPPTDAELRALALARRDQLLAEAATRIAPLQDAADLGVATDAEVTALLAWKRYRVDLNRIDQQDDYPSAIAWPSAPAGPA